MSFSSQVKEELSAALPAEEHCLRAELAAFLMEYRGVLPDAKLLSRRCCKKAFLKGVFLAAGTIGDPEKLYQLEIILNTEEAAEFVQKQLAGFGISGKVTERKGRYAVYVKEGDQIADFLAAVQANTSLLALENVRVVKDVRNTVNRKVNCETANLNKTVVAAQTQIRDIEWIQSNIGFDKLPDPLREVAQMRLLNPDVTLQELGDMMDPPVGKSGVNHRLRRLHEIAEEGNYGKQDSDGFTE